MGGHSAEARHLTTSLAFGARMRGSWPCEDTWAAGLANCLSEGRRPKGPFFEEPFGTLVATPFHAGCRSSIWIDPRDYLPITRCSSYGRLRGTVHVGDSPCGRRLGDSAARFAAGDVRAVGKNAYGSRMVVMRVPGVMRSRMASPEMSRPKFV